MHNDFFTASEISYLVGQLQLKEIDSVAGLDQLESCIHELRSIPASWKDALFEICQDMEDCEGDDNAMSLLAQRVEKAVDLIQDLHDPQ